LFPVLLAFALAARTDAEGPQAVKAALETPFTIAAGETARVEPEGLEVTLRSVSDDSGCVEPNDCSEMLFKGTLVARLEEKREMAQIMAFFAPGSPYRMNFAGYEIQLTALRCADAKGPLLATFKVVVKAEDED
jgi:hypothetical protein